MVRSGTVLSSLLIVLAMIALTTGAFAGEPAAGVSALEAELRTHRPDIVRWETVPVARNEHAPQSEAGDIVLVGRIGARTAVRFADGRVRWYTVAGYRPVLVAAHVVESGAPLSSADATTAERDIVGSACEPVSLDAGTRWRATRRLAADEALCAHALAPAPDVERDRSVTLTTERGAITAARVLVAAADARVGERVRLRDPATGEAVNAIVTGAAAARVLQE